MTGSSHPIPWQHVGRTLLRFLPLWGGTTLLFATIGVGYAVLRSPKWVGYQPVLVRNEATGSPDRMGRFPSLTELKAAQETILEMVKHPAVVTDALEQIGPPPGRDADRWPTTTDIEKATRKGINLRAPRGSDFGNTEVMYLTAEAENRERALELAGAVYRSLTEHLGQVRRVRADSVIDELVAARDLAQENLREASERLETMERRIGSDLGELRNLSETISGDGSSRRELAEIQRDLQNAELELERSEALRELLEQGQQHPERLRVAGGDLLSTQPSLLRLKDGLIDAQLAASQLASRYTAEHPRMRGAQAAQQEIRDQLRSEIETVLETMQPGIRSQQDRVRRLRDRHDSLSGKMESLAALRTPYAQLVAEVRHRTGLLEESQRALTEAQATRSAALSTTLLAPLGTARVGDHPEGPGGATLVGGATSAGLLFGLGLVFLIAPGPHQPGYGRRWSDMLGGRRRADQTATAPREPSNGSPDIGSPVASRPTAAAGPPGDPGVRPADAEWYAARSRPEEVVLSEIASSLDVGAASVGGDRRAMPSA